MKKLLLIVIFFALVFSISNANAQRFGLLGGINMANIYGDDAEPVEGVDSKSILGATGGISFISRLGRHVTFRAELLYSQKGNKWEEGDNFESFKLAYLEKNILFQIFFPSRSRIKLFVMGGGYLALNLSAKGEWEFEGDSGSEDIKDDTKTFDYGFVFGGGILIKRAFEITAKYSMGIAKFYEWEGELQEMKNKAIQILAGIYL